MNTLAALMALIHQVTGTPYVLGGDSPAGTDCSGLASWVSNTATGRPIFGDRFHTGNEEAALAARGFRYGTAPDALVIGWNGRHTAVTLPDGTPVSSGEGGGVRIGGSGAYQPQFTHHMYLPVPSEDAMDAPADPALWAALVDAPVVLAPVDGPAETFPVDDDAAAPAYTANTPVADNSQWPPVPPEPAVLEPAPVPDNTELPPIVVNDAAPLDAVPPAIVNSQPL
jgi:hypothetical protein